MDTAADASNAVVGGHPPDDQVGKHVGWRMRSDLPKHSEILHNISYAG
jgi:hypothetical protein